jgi:predicted nucleotidyltransferase
VVTDKLKTVEENTIFVVGVGSRLYGIHNEDSDYDKAGVMMPSLKSLILSDLDNLNVHTFDQYKYPGEDFNIYDIRKVFRLLLDNSPNMFDLIFAPESAFIKTSSEWEEVIANRELFISKKCRYTFSGYAISQLRRIKTHRKYLLDPPKKKPERSDFGLPDNPVFPSSQLKGVLSSVLTIIPEEDKPQFIDQLDGIYRDYVSPLIAEYVVEQERSLAYEWLLAGIKSQANTLIHIPSFVKDEYLDMAHKEISFYQANNDWKQYTSWKKSRNKNRAVLEEKFGYDTKHACHLVRLLRSGLELLESGTLSVDRRGIDADELVSIRKGGWSFDEVEEYCSIMEGKLDKAYKESSLQYKPDSSSAISLCYNLVEGHMKKYL